MEFDYPLNMTKKDALIRRANRLIEWLHREEYANYVDENSVENLKKLIKRIIWALDQTIPENDWRQFLRLFQESRNILSIKEGEDQATAYTETTQSLISSLESFRGHVEDM